MKSLHFVLFVSLLSATAVIAHGQTSTAGDSASASSSTRAKRGPVFRANKDQVIAAQNILRSKGSFTGGSTGKLDAATRDAIKGYQKDNGLRSTGTLNRATLEKMGIELTEKQKAVPASANSYASQKKKSGGADGSRRAVFRATKEQIMEAQKLLRTGGLYSGEDTGKLDDTTREGLKKYQESKGLKATGTLNQSTLDKMGIALTDKQKVSDSQD